MIHNSDDEKKYAIKDDQLTDILTCFVDKGHSLSDTLKSKIEGYLKAQKTAFGSDPDENLHTLARLVNTGNDSWVLNETLKNILNQKLEEASNAKDEDQVKSLLDVYIKLFKIDDRYHTMSPELKTYFDELEENETFNSEMRKAVQDKNLALIIGAGLTAKFIGDWSKLLKSLMTMRVFDTYNRLLKESESTTQEALRGMKEYMDNHHMKFIADSVNYLERGEYLRFDSADHSNQIGTIAENRYREKFFAQQVNHIIMQSLYPDGGKDFIQTFIDEVKNPKIPESTLSAVIRLCLEKDIQEIITYNFDTILDRLLVSKEVHKALFKKTFNVRVEVYSYRDVKPVLCLFTPTKNKSRKKNCKTIKIYHVHGVVDRELRVDVPLIFSENSYQNYQKATLNWGNIRLADIQSRYNTLCVGFSGDDPNFRLLRRFFGELKENPVMGDYLKDEAKTKMFLLRNYESDKNRLLNPYDLDTGNNTLLARACIETYFDMVNSYYLEQYNINIIWSYGFDHMARQIKELADLPVI